MKGILAIGLVTLSFGALPALATQGTGSGAGGGNPASINCAKQGGIGFTIDEGSWGGNQRSLCQFEDGSLIEEWTLMRGSDKLSEAEQAFLKSEWTTYGGPIDTWGKQACQKAGGTPFPNVEHLRPDVVRVLCRFSDKSEIEEWTLAGGAGMYPTLAAKLKK